MAEPRPRRLPDSVVTTMDQSGLDSDERRPEESIMEVDLGDENAENGVDSKSGEESYTSESSENEEDITDSSNESDESYDPDGEKLSHSSDAEVDEIDSDLEYHKEMDEQRIADQKNGHFVEELGPELSTLRTRRKVFPKSRAAWLEAAAQVSSSNTRVSSLIAMNLDAKVEEGEKGLVGAAVTQGSYAKNNGSFHSSHTSNLQGDRGIDFMGLEKAEISGRIAVHRGERDLDSFSESGALISSVTKVKHAADKSAFDAKKSASQSSALNHEVSQLIVEDHDSNLKGKSDLSVMESGGILGMAVVEESSCLDIGDTRGSEREVYMPRRYGHSATPVHALEAQPISVHMTENAAALDLMESQPLTHRQIKPSSLIGPPAFEAAIFDNLESQPLTHIHSHPSLPIGPIALGWKSNDGEFSVQSSIHKKSQTQNASKSTPNTQSFTNKKSNLPPLPKNKQPNTQSRQPQAQNTSNPILSQPNNNYRGAASTGKELAALLFKSRSHVQKSSSSPSISSNAAALMPSEFPPLKNTETPSIAAAIELKGRGDATGDSQPTDSDVEMRNYGEHIDVNDSQHVEGVRNSTATHSGAAFADNDQNNENSGMGNNNRVGGNEEAQPKIFFGRSMADVLRSGQPADGPILLNHEQATKRGEVRLVEGKPCLCFSANETSVLAGRIGPAIVGKFSHSIPTAHQIQKDLGNLKLVGAMSWNFLNAKHIFIQLSDMHDYVKLLNGPNNSPVWYIEHHPMRVFKWTPDFDPFFEIPVVALWCNILALPVHLFEESSLIAIGEMLGKAVQVDRATITRSRVSFARICVEVDLSRPIPEEIDLDIAGKRVTLKVKWDKIPLYCNECRHVGHSARTCYASGKRPIPPKRDYTHGPPRQNRATPQTERVPRPEGQATSTPTDAARQAQDPQGRPHVAQVMKKPPQEVSQQQRSVVRTQETGSREMAPGYNFYPGSSSAATGTAQATEEAGFIAPKKKKKVKSAASRQRQRERRRLRRQMQASSAGAQSDGGGDHGAEEDDSSSGSEQSTRSLSPSHRSRHAVGPLAMVVHDNNMFGALEDFPSEDEESNADEAQDTRMVEASSSRTRQMESEVLYLGYTSPPLGGSSKRARLSASDAH